MITCDACGPFVKALYSVYKGEFVLSFCGHHYYENSVVLQAEGWDNVVLDVEKGQLYDNRIPV